MGYPEMMSHEVRELNKIERNNHVKTFVGVEAVS